MLENTLKTSGLIIGALTFIAYMKEFIFYSYFGIDISNYIELSEVFTSFIDDVSVNILLYIILIFICTVLLYFINKKSITISETKAFTFLPYNTYKVLFIIIGVLLIFLIVMLFYINTFSNDVSFLFLAKLRLLVTIFILTIVSIAKFTNIVVENFIKHPFNTVVIISLTGMILYCCFSLPTDIENKSYEYKRMEYTFYLNDDSILKTDSCHAYLGRTKNNLFMYNLNTKQAYIFNTSDIKQERIKTLPKLLKK